MSINQIGPVAIYQRTNENVFEYAKINKLENQKTLYIWMLYKLKG